MVDIFLTDTAERLAALQTAAAQGDAQVLRREAHAVRGSALHLGLGQMVDLSGRLEEMGRAGTTDGAADVLQALELAFERLRPALPGMVAAAAHGDGDVG